MGGYACPWVDDKAAPELALLEGLEVEASHHAKVVGPTFKRFEEVRVVVGVGIDDRAGSKDNLGSCSVNLTDTRTINITS